MDFELWFASGLEDEIARRAKAMMRELRADHNDFAANGTLPLTC